MYFLQFAVKYFVTLMTETSSLASGLTGRKEPDNINVNRNPSADFVVETSVCFYETTDATSQKTVVFILAAVRT
jgi:hypothetical protein